jgi:hypothetical protein
MDTFFIAVTELGSEIFYMIFLPPIFWCLNKKFGLRLFYITLLAGYFTALIKNLTDAPRPPEKYWKVEPEASGFPSGHTIGPTTMWGYIIIKLKSKIILVIGILIIFLVSISRLYLGVHYPIDILGGLVFGIGLLLGFLHFEPILTKKINKLNFYQKISLSILVPACLVAIAFTTLPGDIRAVSGSGAIMGISIGYLLESRIINFKTDVNANIKVIRVIIGFLITFIIFFSIYSLMPRINIWHFILALSGGFNLTFLAPLVFTSIERNIGKK